MPAITLNVQQAREFLAAAGLYPAMFVLLVEVDVGGDLVQ